MTESSRWDIDIGTKKSVSHTPGLCFFDRVIHVYETPSFTKMPATKPFLSPEAGRPQIRRLSSATAKFDDLALGPAIVVPPEKMDQPSDAHETAAALEMAKHRLSKIEANASGISTPETPPESDVTDTYAFAFDIDGVLIRGGKPIPQAVEAMKVLNGQNEYGVKV